VAVTKTMFMGQISEINPLSVNFAPLYYHGISNKG
jgi:hypothetical protein